MVHYFTVYITPGESSEANEQLRNIRWILYRIRQVEGDVSNVIKSGDLNKLAMDRVDS